MRLHYVRPQCHLSHEGENHSGINWSIMQPKATGRYTILRVKLVVFSDMQNLWGAAFIHLQGKLGHCLTFLSPIWDTVTKARKTTTVVQ